MPRYLVGCRVVFFALIILTAHAALGQGKSPMTAKDYYTEGNMRAHSGDYAGAIEQYSLAIGLDSAYVDAFYNRGTSKIRLKQYEAAIGDFDMAVRLRPDFTRAISNRGIAKLQADHVEDAISDFTAALKLDPKAASVYFMRAQARMQMGDKDGGCSDLHQAHTLGDDRAARFIAQYCGDSATTAALGRPEEVLLEWPKSEGWAPADTQDADGVRLVEYIRKGESLEHWTEIGTMTTYRGMAVAPVDDAMKQLFKQAQSKMASAKLTVLERDTSAKYPWIIFKIETGADEPESQVWQIINGTRDLFMNFRAIKQKSIPDELTKKWTAFFKTAKVVAK